MLSICIDFGGIDITISSIIVRTLFDEIIREAGNLPDFKETMVNFSKELKEQWQSIEQISREFDELGDRSLSKSEEKKLTILENTINQLHFKILTKQLNFIHHWKPSLETHKESTKFSKFVELTTNALDNALLPMSEDLKSVIQTRGQWIRTRKTERTVETIQIMTIIFGLVGILEIIVAYYQTVDNEVEGLVLFIIPIVLFVLVIILLYLILRFYWRNNRRSNNEEKKTTVSTNRENKLFWELVFILFSVSLSFSVINASNAGILVSGDLLYYILGNKTVDVTKIYSSLLFMGLIFVNLCLIAICWKKEWVSKFGSFYLRFFVSFFIGISPMFFYYLGFLFSKLILNMTGL